MKFKILRQSMQDASLFYLSFSKKSLKNFSDRYNQFFFND